MVYFTHIPQGCFTGAEAMMGVFTVGEKNMQNMGESFT